MYKADPRIVRYLREYDRELGVRWNRDRGRWQVTWRGKDAWCVCNEDGSYRPLDERVVTQAKLQDIWSHKSAADMLRIQEEENHRIRGLRKARERDEFHQWAKEEMHPRVVGCGSGGGRFNFPGWSPEA